MSKEEIALELTKLVYGSLTKIDLMSKNNENNGKVITDIYNYIFKNLDCTKCDE